MGSRHGHVSEPALRAVQEMDRRMSNCDFDIKMSGTTGAVV